LAKSDSSLARTYLERNNKLRGKVSSLSLIRALHRDPLGHVPGVKLDMEADHDIWNPINEKSSLIFHGFSMTSSGLLGYAPLKNEKG
jgi:hypothetical protein